ncbi:MAG: GC-type dockerin domain-anchored protein [Phycisphaerales bacterium JB059]
MHTVIAAFVGGVAPLSIAMGPGAYELGAYTVDGGGGTLAGATYQLSGSVGQPDAGGPLQGPVYCVVGGFWPGGGETACVADLAAPQGTLDFSDVVAFLTAYGIGDLSVDFAEPSGVLDFSDIIVFLGEYGAGCP